ncbi:hypothetical protein FSARC_4531 [Fusarium sarcochroum]|uniref:DUF6590 domain-containing protein n=1 Tax=Fusarium sarcochroum TaxID=1208366 RepID=A0A8H4U223_9HYPO|nr:hypothetical protein FSARC_4531 [Fusarium sarcochroum]
MSPYQDYRINKPAPHHNRGRIRDRCFNNSVKNNIFARRSFSPSLSNRSLEESNTAWLQAEQRDSPSLIVSALNDAADDWECKDCHWKIRTLAGKFNLNLSCKSTPTSHPATTSAEPGREDYLVTPPPDSPESLANTPPPRSHNDIVSLKRLTLTNDAGNGDPFYGVHQAHLDLSLGESVTVHMRDTDQKRNRRELRPGTIISAPYHSQYRDSTVSTFNSNTAVSGFGAVYSKYRKMIILEVWADHVVCLPVYSYNGIGLQNRQGMKDEYMDIRDAYDEAPEPGDTDDKPLQAIRSENWPGRNSFITGKTVIKLTEKINHHIAHKCSIEGKVETAHFQRMYNRYLEMVNTKALDVFGKPTEFMTIIPH